MSRFGVKYPTDDAVKKGCAGAYKHEHIHIGYAVAQGAEGAMAKVDDANDKAGYAEDELHQGIV